MSDYAVVKIGGSQFKIAVGGELSVEKLEVEEGKVIEFNEVLLLVTDKKVKIGQPFVRGAKVRAKILGQLKGKKIRVATYKAKSRYRRVKGHRKLLTKIRIEKIVAAKPRKGTAKTQKKATEKQKNPKKSS